eukprot:TRINITY_DN869_c0_g4_i1.p2 TRINITY_DN869_c0_g4~~TRINITY_DN869_c0_g4_i1.p2  ORF type:complete len:107 (-),score=4.78 TRINITY_DN869_c0_g4_i1:208-528(-)
MGKNKVKEVETRPKQQKFRVKNKQGDNINANKDKLLFMNPQSDSKRSLVFNMTVVVNNTNHYKEHSLKPHDRMKVRKLKIHSKKGIDANPKVATETQSYFLNVYLL